MVPSRRLTGYCTLAKSIILIKLEDPGLQRMIPGDHALRRVLSPHMVSWTLKTISCHVIS